MSVDPPRVLIAGAGIGGLATAVALRRRGVEVEVAEAADHVRTVGAGITIQPNARAVLSSLGIELDPDDVLPIGEVAMLDARGRTLMGGAFSNPEGPPGVNIRRADLHRALLRAAEGVPLRVGSPVISVREEKGNGCRVAFGDGRDEAYDAMIGADGLHSNVRASLLPPQACELRFAGQACWRFTVNAPELHPHVTVERWNAGTRVGVVPLSRGGIYVYLVQSAAPGRFDATAASPDWMREHLGHLDDRVPALIDALEASPKPHVHLGDLCDQPQISFGRGRVTLIGDAAHALTPNMGQGAAMAIEDAGALALAATEASPEHWPALMDQRRRARVEHIARTSWRIGQMAHWRGGLARALRDLVLRTTPTGATDRMVRDSWRPGLELAAQLRG